MSSELPLEGFGDLLVISLEAQEAILELLKRLEVIGRQSFALNNGEVDLNLIEPTRMNWAMDKDQVGIALLETCSGARTTMGRAVIHDPEDSPSLGIGWLGHYVLHKPIEGRNAGLRLAPAKEFDPVDVKGRKICPRPASCVLMFDLHHGAGLNRIGGMATTTRLDTGLLIGGDDELVIPEAMAVPYPFIEVQDSSCFARKLGITRKDPRAIPPRSDRILMEPTPYRAVTDRGHKTRLPNLSAQIRNTPARKRYLECCRQLTCQSLNLDDQIWGGKTGADPAGDALRAPGGVPRKIVFATC